MESSNTILHCTSTTWSTLEMKLSSLNITSRTLSSDQSTSCAVDTNHCKNVTGKNVPVKILLVKMFRLTIQLFDHLLN